MVKDLSQASVNKLFELAKASILSGLGERVSLPKKEDPALQALGASFVTLLKYGELRGCIGSLQAYQPLAEDVAANAANAAFRDPRFNPVSKTELDSLLLEISILTEPVAIEKCRTMEDLIDSLVPGKDGLILSDGLHRATFLPSVWEQLPNKEQFVLHLMRKGGMTAWSDRMKCERYYVKFYKKHWAEI